MYKRASVLWSFLVLATGVTAQDVLDGYIREGLQNNLVLKEKKIGLEKSMLALREAKSLFLPTTWFETQYTLAQGGRSFDIPVGDLMNPVYKTLNQLTGTNQFPQISNVSEQFLPNNFYDVRIKTTMPVIHPEIRISRDIKVQEIGLQENEVEIYKRELVKEIKSAYYQYLAASQSIRIFQNAEEVVNQNLKVNQSLLQQGKGLYAYVSRAESEVQSVNSQLATAVNQQRNAQAYFNFLLNRSLDEPVQQADYEMDAALLQSISLADSIRVSAREELKSLALAQDINRNVLKMNRSFRTPRLNTFVDLAAQGFDFRVNNKSFFYLAGLQLQIPIFTGKRNLYHIQQTEWDMKNLELQASQTEKQLALAAFVSRNNAWNAYNNFQSSGKQQESARQYFKLIDRGYKEGVNSFIEWLDARNQLTTAQLQATIHTYQFLSALADYERQTATYSFNQ